MGSWRRLPFVGLALAAGAGILAADPAALPLVPLLAAVGLLALAVLALRRTEATLLFVAAAFCAIHTFRHHDAPSERVARFVANSQVVVRGAGLVVSEPRVSTDLRGKPVSRFQLRAEGFVIGDRQWRTPAIFLVTWRGGTPTYGDRLAFVGSIVNLGPARNPGQFDFAALNRRRGVYSAVEIGFPSDARVTASGLGSPIVALALRSRAWMQERLCLDLDDAPEVAGVVQSMVLGLKTETPDEIQQMFERTGTLHVFVVSGLHVGLLAFLVLGLLRTFGVGRRVAALCVIPMLCFYALVTGLSPGSVRAALMASIVIGGFAFDRAAGTLNSLAAAFFLILVFDGEQLFMPGFQFSFAVVFAIVLIAPGLHRRFRKIGAPDSFLPRPLWNPVQHFQDAATRWLGGLVAVSLAAWIGSLFFTTKYFHLISPSAILANVFVVPTAFVILAQGMLSLLSATASEAMAAVFNNANFAATRVLLAVVQFFASLPGGYHYVEIPPRRSAPPVEVTVLDVGAGGAIHVRDGGGDWMIDCGHRWACETIVRPYLRMRGVNRLKGLFVTHGDAGHLGGAIRMMNDFPPECILDSPLRDRSSHRKALHNHLEQARSGKSIVSRGDTVTSDQSSRWRVLYPPAGLRARMADDKALVLQLEAGGRRVLFMSDNGFLAEQWLLREEPDLRSDILVQGAHRSDLGGSPEFIAAVSPAVMVLVPGAPGDKGGMPQDWRRIVEERGVRIFDLSQTGAVCADIYDDGIVVRSWLGDQVFNSRRR